MIVRLRRRLCRRVASDQVEIAGLTFTPDSNMRTRIVEVTGMWIDDLIELEVPDVVGVTAHLLGLTE